MAVRRRPGPPWWWAAMLGLTLFAAACSGETDVAEGRRPEVAMTPTAGVVATPTPVPDIQETPTPEGPQPIVIATLLGETGVMETLDAAALAGVLAEVERINESGGLLDREVVVRRYDTNSRTSLTERHAETVIANPPDLVIVSCDVEFSRPALDLASDAGLVTISPCAADDGYRNGDLGSRNFTMGAPEYDRGRIVGQAAFRIHGPTAMLLRDTTSPEALSFCEGFEDAFVASGGVVLYDDRFNYDTLEPLQDRLKDDAPPTAVIAVCSHVPGGVDGAPSVISILRTLGFEAPIAAGSSVDQIGWFAAVPQLNDLLFVSWSSVYGNDPDDEVNRILARATALDAALDEELQEALVVFDQRSTEFNEAEDDFDAADPEDNEDEAERLAAARRARAEAETAVRLAEQAAQVRIGGSTILGAESVMAWERAVLSARSVDPSRVASSLGSFANQDLPTGPISFLSGERLDATRRYRLLRVLGGQLTVLEVVPVG